MFHAIILILAICTSAIAQQATQVAGEQTNQQVQSKFPQGPMLFYINRARSQSGLVSLQRISSLDSLCRSHVRDIAQMQNMSHQGTDGRWPWERAGFLTGDEANENIGEIDKASSAPLTASGLHAAFMSSKGHRENLLNPEWRYFGVAYAKNSKTDKYFCACLFSKTPPRPGRPATSQVTTVVVPDQSSFPQTTIAPGGQWVWHPTSQVNTIAPACPDGACSDFFPRVAVPLSQRLNNPIGTYYYGSTNTHSQ